MNKLDYKLVNIALICLICFLLIKSNELWIFVVNKLFNILFPIFIGFAIAYFLYPIFIKLNKKIPRSLSIGILILAILLLIFMVIILVVPLLYEQILSLIGYIIIFIKKYNINLNFIEENLNNIFNQVGSIGKIVSDGAIKTINTSISFVTNMIVSMSSSVYFLIDMDNIRNYIKNYLIKKSEKLYKYFKLLDNELKNYFKSLSKLIIISFFEYTIIYYMLGHPHALLLGFLSAISNLIPCFGGIIVQVIAFITSFVINIKLGITVLIITFILSIFDSYILNPFIYGKSNKIHPIIVITSVFAGGILFGGIGVLVSLPLSIIIVSSVKFLNEKNN